MPDATHETWLPVPGYEGLYEVSDLGRVRSFPRPTIHGPRGGRILKPGRRKYGYLHVNLHADGKPWTRQVHQLVLLAFVGPCPAGLQTRHLDGNPANNVLPNLVYGTPKENQQDRLRHRGHHNTAKTHCPQGHEYTPENTYIGTYSGRQCKICTKARAAAAKRRARDIQFAS